MRALMIEHQIDATVPVLVLSGWSFSWNAVVTIHIRAGASG
jgi:hypothetical protein